MAKVHCDCNEVVLSEARRAAVAIWGVNSLDYWPVKFDSLWAGKVRNNRLDSCIDWSCRVRIACWRLVAVADARGSDIRSIGSFVGHTGDTADAGNDDTISISGKNFPVYIRAHLSISRSG